MSRSAPGSRGRCCGRGRLVPSGSGIREPAHSGQRMLTLTRTRRGRGWERRDRQKYSLKANDEKEDAYEPYGARTHVVRAGRAFTRRWAEALDLRASERREEGSGGSSKRPGGMGAGACAQTHGIEERGRRWGGFPQVMNRSSSLCSRPLKIRLRNGQNTRSSLRRHARSLRSPKAWLCLPISGPWPSRITPYHTSSPSGAQFVRRLIPVLPRARTQQHWPGLESSPIVTEIPFGNLVSIFPLFVQNTSSTATTRS